jgi:DNA-binding transcriptional regulator YhcF (GntR family)
VPLLPQEDRSIYLQIEGIIRNGILNDLFEEESRVPSTNELARHYTINPATAAKGLNRLVEEGILYKKRGIGMFVASGAKQKILTQRREQFKADYLKPLLGEAKSIGIAKEELLLLLQQTMEEEDKP